MRRLFLPFFISLFLASSAVFACDSCGCSLARVTADGKFDGPEKQRAFFDFTFEQQVWQKRDPELAHSLHHSGHDAHVKTTEEFYHFSAGANPWESFSFLAEIPYVVRHSLDVEHHSYLGGRQRSEGFGDLNLTGIFKPLRKEGSFLGPLAGIKFPTGRTTERDMQGGKFEPELQPGSGSFDPSLGTAFQYTAGRLGFHGNSIFTFRTKGAQDFKFGNLFSTYLYADYLLNPKSTYFQSRVGIDAAIRNERKQKNHGRSVDDSGGTTFLLGPEFSIRGNRNISAFGNILFPVYQNLGGVHQLVRFVWNAGVKVSF